MIELAARVRSPGTENLRLIVLWCIFPYTDADDPIMGAFQAGAGS
jgi:hypothetical protein